jgi:hypothetical protein
MFGRSKPVVFDPYGGRRRSGARVPRWLVLLLAGIGVGAAGVLYVQESYLPPRLSASEAAKLRNEYETADSERQRLRTDLAQATKALESTRAENKKLADEAGSSRQTIEGLRESVSSLVSALPPDPRGGIVQVRAASFAVQGGQLQYNVVLTRDRAAAKTTSGVMQLSVIGKSARGTDATVKLAPVNVALNNVENLRGSLPLPQDFDPRDAAIHILDRNGSDAKVLGMRVMHVK